MELDEKEKTVSHSASKECVNADLIEKIYHIAAPNMNRVIAQFFSGGGHERPW